jgi:hypothetical protein
MDAATFNINTTSYTSINAASVGTATAVFGRTNTVVYTSTVMNVNLSLPTRYAYHSMFSF